jgi:hypothetical protein
MVHILYEISHWAGSCRVNTLDLYSGGTRFKFRSEYRLFWLIRFVFSSVEWLDDTSKWATTISFQIFLLTIHDQGARIAQWYSTGLQVGRSRVRVSAEAGNFSRHHRVQTGSGAHPASYPMGTRGSFPGDKVAVA